MDKLKRLPVKYIRDYIKKDYKYDSECYICGCDEKLELHHLYSLSELWNTWCSKNGIDIEKIETVTEIEELRHKFSVDEEVSNKISEEYLYTLCSTHHKQLHTIYGQRYANYLVPKILRWLDIKREKERC